MIPRRRTSSTTIAAPVNVLEEAMVDSHDTERPDSAAAPAPPQKEIWKYEDPNKDPGRKGLLLSNEIARFCAHQLLIDKNYDPKRLRPAAYTLRIGTDYVDSRGKKGRLTK